MKAISGLFLFASVLVHAAPDDFHLSDDVAGPTCANFLNMGNLGWHQRGGDWVDAAGQTNGNKAFDAQSVLLNKGRPFIEWDVTALAQAWATGKSPNEGFLLRGLKGPLTGVVDFHSRESTDGGAKPVLKLKWADGSVDRLLPVADTFLDCSTVRSLGQQRVLKVSGGQSALIRFVLPNKKSKLAAASLLLVSDKQYGNGLNVGVFRVAPPYTQTEKKVDFGLAVQFVNDKNVVAHPDVVFFADFEDKTWLTAWNHYSPNSNTETISEDVEQSFVPFHGNALRVRIVKGSNYGLDLRYLFLRAIKIEPEEIYFRYYLRFGDNWDPYLDGGKLPGIAGTYERAGWGMRKSDGLNGWSMRGAFAARPIDVASVRGVTTIGSYTYHAAMKENSGDYWGWNEGPAGVLQNNRWYAIEQYVKLNTPGKNDGIFRAWIDGQAVFEKKDIRYRNANDLKIESIWLNIYHGGTSVAPKDMSLYIDNVVIAKSYIGPVKP